MEGTSRRTAPSASQAIAANARSPRATGGHATAAPATRIGPSGREPDRRSIGPPGR